MSKVIYVHRGRNQKSKEIGRVFTQTDYNFDYRGKSKLVLLLKAFLTSTEIKKAEIYFVEGGLCLNVAFFLKLFRMRKSKIILMVPEPLFNPKQGFLSKLWIKIMMRKVDGVIAISEMVKDDAKLFYDGRVEIAHHYVVDASNFMKSHGDLASKKIVFMAERPTETGYTKGLDVALNAFKIIKETEKNAELLVIGSGTKELNLPKGAKGLGFVDPVSILSKSSIVLAPARYDAFCLAIAEASMMGVIPIISKYVGSKEFVEKASKDLVTSTNPSDVAKAVLDLWSMPIEKRVVLGKKLVKLGSKYTKKYCLDEYRRAWKKLV